MPTHTERERQRNRRQQQNTMAPRFPRTAPSQVTTASLAPQLGQMGQQQGGNGGNQNNQTAPRIGDVVGRMTPQPSGSGGSRHSTSSTAPSLPLHPGSVADRALQAQRSGDTERYDALRNEYRNLRRFQNDPEFFQAVQDRNRASAQTDAVRAGADQSRMEGVGAIAAPTLDFFARQRSAEAQENVAQTGASADRDVAQTQAGATRDQARFRGMSEVEAAQARARGDVGAAEASTAWRNREVDIMEQQLQQEQAARERQRVDPDQLPALADTMGFDNVQDMLNSEEFALLLQRAEEMGISPTDLANQMAAEDENDGSGATGSPSPNPVPVGF